MTLRISGLIAAFALAGILGSAHCLAQNAYITNSGSDTVSVIDTSTNTVIGTPINVGSVPTGLAVTPDGSKVYVANSYTDTVSVIDTSTNTVTATVLVGPNPYGVAVTPDGSQVYVANSGSCGACTPPAAPYPADTVSVIDTSTNTVIDPPIPVGSIPFGVAVSPDGSKVYVGNYLSNTVSVIDTATDAVTAFPVPGPHGLAVSPDSSILYVASTNRSPAALLAIATATNTVTATIPVGCCALGLAVTPDGSKVYVSNEALNINTVAAIDTSTNTVSPIQVGYDPWGIAVTADGSKVYVVNESSNSVSVVDPATNTVSATISGFNGPTSFGVFIQPKKPPPRFAGTPGYSNCHGKSVSALAQQYHGLNSAAAALEFTSVGALQNAIMAFCKD